MRLLNKRKMRELAKRYLDDINVYIPNVDTEAGQLSEASGRQSPLHALRGQMPHPAARRTAGSHGCTRVHGSSSTW